ncbi:MAG TPA: mannosyltransferase family protein [Candidatus Binatia bacterium]|nr:mannosyltransferase family protein [Candidatus Binatia bacterium]
MRVRSARFSLSTAAKRSLRMALIVFLVVRILLSVWAALVIEILPATLEPDPVLRPYLGQPALPDGATGRLLGPWQRFDTMRYLSLAQDGYDAQNSVFPPLYPLLIGVLGRLLAFLFVASNAVANMTAALLISNLSLLAALALLHFITTQETDEADATRTVLYLAFFPTGFFLFAAYSESLFLLLAVGAIWLAHRERPLWAGILALLAALTRLTGWTLCLPLAYIYVRRRSFNWRNLDWRVLSVILPLLGLAGFLAWRAAAGLPPIAQVYEQYWFQQTGLPGADLGLGLRSLATGNGPRAGEISLAFDIASTAFLVATTILVFRRLPVSYGLYSAFLLFFMLLPTSEVKPLYSFSRYALMFFPSFMLLGQAGRNPWLHRLILYASLILALFLSGQFFLWGWVA